MSFFLPKYESLFPNNEAEILLCDRLIDEVNKTLIDDSTKTNNIDSVKSALFNIAALTNVLRGLGIDFSIDDELKRIRNSLAHIDERLQIFDYKPTMIQGEKWTKTIEPDGYFKLNKTYNFQGAIISAKVSTSGNTIVLGPYGMVDDYFIWIDKNGKQQNTSLEVIRRAFRELLESLRI